MLRQGTLALAWLAFGSAVAMYGGTITLGAMQDANIANGLQTNSNLNLIPYLMVNWGASFPFSPPTTSRGLIQFDLSGYAGETITSATLNLYHSVNPGDGKIFDLFRNTSSWDESTVTFQTSPMFDPTSVSTLALGSNGAPGVYLSFDVTTVVQGWIQGSYGNDGLTLIERNEVPTQWIMLISSEGPPSFAPELILSGPGIVGEVPEPGTLFLLSTGLGLAGSLRRKR